MLSIQYPPMLDQSRSLTDLLGIESHDDYDTIYLGSDEQRQLLGFIEYRDEWFKFYPSIKISTPFPPRSNYYSSICDVLVYVINDQNLCVDLCILSNRKNNKEDK